ncbi:MAG: bifunctional transcriptional activator/DNA repair enzyme AdaA [Alkalispirochaetaceae bacterium]
MIENDALRREYYDALLRRDASYLGTFVVGVVTTGIFCLPTCRARKPKFENSEFYTGAGEALRAGYTPCKVCRPTELAGTPPPMVREALELLHSAPGSRVRDGELRQRGLSPEALRRWCKEHLGLTFQGYQRMLRINRAYRSLAGGRSVTESAFDSGYESLSGFAYGFASAVKSPPSRQRPVITLTRFPTPLGPMFAAATDEGLALLEFTDRRMLEREFADLSRRLDAPIVRGENAHTEAARSQLEEYFLGRRRAFSIELVTPGSPFQQSVWEQLRRIPFGETRSYAEQARAIGRASAVRAVARANGSNRLAVVIPCHRVLGSDGSLTGYAGGLQRKRWLLAHEGALPTALATSPSRTCSSASRSPGAQASGKSGTLHVGRT